MKTLGYLAGILLLGVAATACSGGDSQDISSQTQASERGVWTPAGKADEGFVASCKGYCGRVSKAGCWCDDQCEQFGDCCPDVAVICQGGCQSDAQCPEFHCPLGGGIRGRCVQGECKAPLDVTACPGVECKDNSGCATGQKCENWTCVSATSQCTDDSQCPEFQCPLGGGLHGICVQGLCKPPSSVTSCPGVECSDDTACAPGLACSNWVCVATEPKCTGPEDCPEYQCPLGGGAMGLCDNGKCVAPKITQCPGVECSNDQECASGSVCEDWKCVPQDPVCSSDDQCPEYHCPFGGGVHSLCIQGNCTGAPKIGQCPGVECSAEVECQSGKVCENWKCVGP